jgi:hypothetical protein
MHDALEDYLYESVSQLYFYGNLDRQLYVIAVYLATRSLQVVGGLRDTFNGCLIHCGLQAAS